MSIDITTTSQHADHAHAAAATQNFEQLGLAASLLRAIAGLGYSQPTAVQNRVIPLALEQADDCARYDLMVTSQTGSGKTAAFLLPVLQRLIQQQTQAQAPTLEAAPKKSRRKNPRNQRRMQPVHPKALIICPTRELAQQVMRDAVGLVRHTDGMHIAGIVGGMAYGAQLARLQNANVVVATPGRLLDLHDSGYVHLDRVQYLVLDEADRMLDLGFAEELGRIHQLTQAREQTLLFSATFAPRIQRLALQVMRPDEAVQRVQIATPQQKHSNITQKLYWADNHQHRHALLDYWLRDASIDQAIVFSNTQVECDTLEKTLKAQGYSVAALHGGLGQNMRNRRLKALRDGKIQILVATDVAARGIDIPSITHVFNMGLPMHAEDYTHRIGRTGRAGRDGLAITFAEFRDRRRMREVEQHTKQTLKAETIAGLEPTQRERAVRRKKPARPEHATRGRKFGAGASGKASGKAFGAPSKKAGVGAKAGGQSTAKNGWGKNSAKNNTKNNTKSNAKSNAKNSAQYNTSGTTAAKPRKNTRANSGNASYAAAKKPRTNRAKYAAN